MKRRIFPGGILALSFAVVLLAATASTAGTTPTPPAPPLKLDVQSSFGSAIPHKKLIFHATTSNDSTLVATGREIKKTTTQLVADEQTRITVRLKHKEQLRKQSLPPPPKPKVKIKFAATDEFDQTATDALTLRILVRGGGGVIVINELS